MWQLKWHLLPWILLQAVTDVTKIFIWLSEWNNNSNPVVKSLASLIYCRKEALGQEVNAM